jgi:purine-binding chemotaxis protein CheW
MNRPQTALRSPGGDGAPGGAGTTRASVVVLSPERATALMEERARRLAQVPPAATQTARRFDLVTFALGREQYGIEASVVRAIARHGELTAVPGTPAFVRGLINLRGELLLVFDVRDIVGLAGAAAPEGAYLIVLGRTRAEFAVVADRLLGVTAVEGGDVLQPGGWDAGSAREWLRGVTRDGLIVMNGAAVLDDARLVIDVPDDGWR